MPGVCLRQNFVVFCGVFVVFFFFFPLLMSARAAQLFLWASGQGKPHIVTLGAFLKGPGGFLSWGKALNLCQRCDFLLETCFSWKTCWELGEPCWAQYNPIHSQCLQLQTKTTPLCAWPPRVSSFFQLQSGKLLAIRKKMWCISATFLPFIHGSSLSCSC